MSVETATQRSPSSIPVVGGVLYGVIAGVVSLVASIGFLLTKNGEAGRELETVYQVPRGNDAEIALNGIGWLFSNTHTVPIKITGRDGSQITVNLIEELGVQTPLLHYAVPAVVLVLFGMILAQRAGARNAQAGARAGSALVFGYVVVVAAGAIASQLSIDGVTYEPALVQALLVAGIGYPVLAGGLGGFLKGTL